jgi:hypothetical protein
MRAIRDQVKRDYRREANRGVKPARFAVFFVANHGDIPALAMGTVAKRNGVLHADRYGRYRAVFQTRDAAGKARLKQAPTFFEDGVLLVIDRTNGRTVKTFTFNGLARASSHRADGSSQSVASMQRAATVGKGSQSIRSVTLASSMTTECSSDNTMMGACLHRCSHHCTVLHYSQMLEP